MTQPNAPPADRASRRLDRSRLRRIALWLAGIVAFVAIAGFVVAPPIVRSQAEKILTRELGRPTTIDKVAINPFAPSVTISGFNVRESDGTQAFVTFEELHVRASYTSLLRFAPVIDAVRLSKPHARIVRTAPDRFNFSDILDKLAALPKSDEPSQPARFAVYNIEVLDGRIDVDDRVVARKHELSSIDVGLPFISSLESHRAVFVEPRFSVKANGAPIAAKAKSKPFAEARESIVNLELRDFDVTPLVVYSPAKLPVDLRSARLDLDLDVTFAQPPGKVPTIVIAGRTGLKSVAADFPTGGPLLRLVSIAAEIAAVEPLAGRYEVTRLKVASPEVWVRRDKGGEFVLASLFRAPAPTSAAKPVPAPEKPLTYRLDELAVEGGLVHWLDERGSRPIELELRDLRAAVRSISSAPGSRLTFEAAATTDLQESIALGGEAALQPIEVSGKVRIEKLSLPRLWPLAEPLLAAELTSGRLDAGTRFNYQGNDAAPYLVLEGIEATAADIAIRLPRAKQEFLRLATFGLRDGAFDLVAQRVALGDIASKGLRLNAVRERDGSIDLEKILEPARSPPAGAAADATPGKPFVVELRKAVLDNYAIRVEDRTRAEAFTWSLEPLAATVENFSNAPGAKANATLRATVNRNGTLTVAGPFGVNPLMARMRVDARALNIAPVQRLIDDKVNVTVTSGLLSTRGSLSVDLAPGKPLRAAYTGELNLADFAAVDKSSQQDLLKWKSLFVGGIDVDLEPLKVGVGEVALADFYSRLIVNADGTLNLQNIMVRQGQAGVSTTAPTAAPTAAADATPKPAAEAATPSSATPAAGGGMPAQGLPPNIRIGKVTLQGGNVNFSDFFIKPNYSANLTGIGGSVTEMTPETAAELELRGKVDNTAPVEIVGRLNPLAKDLLLDIKASARDIELPPLTPYSVKYAGYGIEKGKLSVTVKYLVENRKLAAENNIHLDQLTFGEKVESPTATKLPVLLAVSLLKDRNGVIDIDLPISGSLDDPQFSVGGLIVRVIVNLLTKIITAPFSALASAFGGKEELSYVEYAAGSATIDGDSRKRLDTLAKALNDRPALKMDVSGHADAAGDREGLKQAYVESRVKAEKMKRLTREGKAPASVDEVTVDKEEYPALLKAAYGAEKFPKPRNVIGFAKDLPVQEMENLMITNAQVTEEDLRQLANRRARAAKEYLVETGKVPAERVFLVAPKLGGEAPKDKGKPTRAEFALR
jgi:hypothetical protein